MDHTLVTTAFDLPGHRVTRNLGVVRGINVRTFGKQPTLLTQISEQARGDAYELMIRHAEQIGANAILGMRYDATYIGFSATEVLCYGTAVQVAAESKQ